MFSKNIIRNLLTVPLDFDLVYDKVIAALDELRRNLREESTAQKVFLGLADVAVFGTDLIHLRFDKIGWAAGDNFLFANSHLTDFLVYLTRELTVLTLEKSFGLFGEGLVASHKYVENCL